MDIDVPSKFNEFVMWLGAPSVLGFVVSWLVEQSAWFAELRLRAKHLVLIVVCLVFPTMAYALQQLPQTTLDEIAPIYEGIVFPAIVAYLGSQIAHWWRKRDNNDARG